MVFAYLNASDWVMYAFAGGILFCWAVEIAAAFRNDAPRLGACSLVLSPIAGLIIGCVHAREWKSIQVMIVFISCILGLLGAMVYSMYRAAENLSENL